MPPLRRFYVLIPLRQQRRPALQPADRAFHAALTRVLPQSRRHSLIVTPQTLPRSHRELVQTQVDATASNPGPSGPTRHRPAERSSAATDSAD